MLGLTHSAIGAATGAFLTGDIVNVAACALGGLLPDIDEPRSTIGWLFFYISYPINKMVGHRTLTHSFSLWLPVLIVMWGVKLDLGAWVALGAITHILADCCNVSGVQALYPAKTRIVCFQNRLECGAWPEIIIFAVAVSFVGLFSHAQSAMGSPRALINIILKSPAVARQEFRRSPETTVFQISGKFRERTGKIIDVTWVYVASDKTGELYEDGMERKRAPEHGEFISARLKKYASLAWDFTPSPSHGYFYAGRWVFGTPLDNATTQKRLRNVTIEK